MKTILIAIFGFVKTYVLTAAAIIGIIWGVFARTEARKDRDTEIEKGLNIVISQNNSLVEKVIKLEEGQSQAIIIQQGISGEIESVSRKVSALQGVTLDHFRQSPDVTKDDLLEIFRQLDLELKKKVNNTSETALGDNI